MAWSIAGFIRGCAEAYGRLTTFISNGATQLLEPPGRILSRLFIVRASVVSVLLGAMLTSVGQARDLLLDADGGYAHWFWLFAAILLFWCVPAHYSARIALEKAEGDTESRDLTSTWLPRLLGLLPIVIVAASGFATALSLGKASGLDEVKIALQGVGRLYVAAGISVIIFVVYVKTRVKVVKLMLDSEVKRTEKTSKKNIFAAFFAALPLLYAIISLLFFLSCVLYPFEISSLFGRILVVPVLLGGWLPVVTAMVIMANRTRFPVALAVAVIFFVISGFANRFHDLRTTAVVAAPNGAERQANLRQAIEHWQVANHCALDPSLCPAPILVAAEGGASRAAFHVATVVGALLDATRDCKDECAWAGDAIFGISGVSGGAFGAATIRAALAEHPGSRQPVCQTIDPGWFGVDDRVTAPSRSWRSCLQSLTTGDYLTPALVGLAFRDWLALPTDGGHSFFADRNVLLETVMERHYNRIVGRDQECSDGDRHGLCAPFGYLEQQKDRETTPWLPLLFLNATTVETGRQIVVSDVYLSSCTSTDHKTFADFMPTAYDLFEVLAARARLWNFADCRSSKDELANAPDVRLSTAAVLSARFPVLSSPANIRDAAGDIVMHGVDGGYFDNSGLVVARFLARELRAQGLHPVILRLSNDPVAPDAPYLLLPGRTARLSDGPNLAPEVSQPEAARAEKPIGARPVPIGPVLEKSPDGWWSEAADRLGSPLLTLNAARQGRNELERASILDVVNFPLVPDSENGTLMEEQNYFYSTVSTRPFSSATTAPVSRKWCRIVAPGQPVMDAVSMSWWMSPSVQAFLDLQLCNQRNADFLDRLVTRETKPYGGPEIRIFPVVDILARQPPRAQASAEEAWAALLSMRK